MTKHCSCAYFYFLGSLSHQHPHAQNHHYMQSNRGRQSLEREYCTLHPYSSQCPSHWHKWYDQNIFISMHFNHGSLPDCGLETGFLKSVNLRPLLRPLKTFCERSKSWDETNLIQCSLDIGKWIHFKEFSNAKAFDFFMFAQICRASSSSSLVIHGTHIPTSALSTFSERSYNSISWKSG